MLCEETGTKNKIENKSGPIGDPDIGIKQALQMNYNMFNKTEENINKINEKMGEVQQIYGMCVVQKRINRVAMRLRSFERSATRVSLGWHLGPWMSGGFSPFPDKNASLSLNYLCKQYGLCCTHAFLWESEILCAK